MIKKRKPQKPKRRSTTAAALISRAFRPRIVKDKRRLLKEKGYKDEQ